MARDRVRFVGERVAAVAAVDPDTAEEALALIDVEYEELPAVFDPFAAMEPDAPILHPDLLSYEGLHGKPTIPNVHSHILIERGDLEQGFAESDLVFEHTFTTPAQHQGYIEPYSVLVAIDPSGRPDVWMSNKGPFHLRAHLAAALDMPEEWVRCNPAHIGGDFGGKGSPMDAPVAYQLARRTGRPVRMVMTYTEELMAGNPRHPRVIRLQTGVKRDGTAVGARRAGGLERRRLRRRTSRCPTVHILGGLEAAGTYRIPHLRIDSRCVYTNQLPARLHARAGPAADGLRRRVADGHHRRGAGHRPGRAAAAQRDPRRRPVGPRPRYRNVQGRGDAARGGGGRRTWASRSRGPPTSAAAWRWPTARIGARRDRG